jgi:hypothetical protein
MLGDATPDTGCGLKLIARRTCLELPFFDHMHRFLPALVQRNGGATISVEVHHRPRTRGVSNYGVLDRLWVGIVDLFGVMWLRRRAQRPEVREVGPNGERGVRFKTYLPGLIFLLTLIAVGYIAESGLLGGVLSEEWIDREVRGKGVSGELLFLAVGGFATAVAIPRHVISFLGGYAFGFALGGALAVAATRSVAWSISSMRA